MAVKKRIAAIDIGSNAMRVALATLYEDGTLTIFKNYRFPIRLGEDAFTTGRLSKKNLTKMELAFGEIFLKLSKYNITDVKAVATSALRNCINASELISRIRQQTGIDINIIDGKLEARLIKNAINALFDLTGKTALLIDIGGGSTEITLTRNNRVAFCKSYPCGTVRLIKSMKGHRVDKDIEKFAGQMREDLATQLRKNKIDICIGTGGNLRRMGKLRKQLLGKSANIITFTELIDIYQSVKTMPLKERMRKFDMRSDRADVIIPAMAIIEHILVDNSVSSIHLPRVGLKEGVILNKLPKKPAIIHIPKEKAFLDLRKVELKLERYYL